MFVQDRLAAVHEILQKYMKKLKERTTHHMGYDSFAVCSFTVTEFAASLFIEALFKKNKRKRQYDLADAASATASKSGQAVASALDICTCLQAAGCVTLRHVLGCHIHARYPYNLDFDFGALEGLNKFSINNLGDPFIESNYGVHSREFEVRCWRANISQGLSAAQQQCIKGTKGGLISRGNVA